MEAFSAEMKARIALEAIKGQKTIQAIASHYGGHPNQVTNWKRVAIQGVPCGVCGSTIPSRSQR
jgi:transposase-like protein